MTILEVRNLHFIYCSRKEFIFHLHVEIRPPTAFGEPVIVDFSMRVVDINSINVEDMDFR